MSATAVIQTKQGIGDVMWHLASLKAIAASAPGGRVTFFSLPTSHAAELLQGEDCIDRVIYYENRGSELARGVHLVRFIATLRREHYKTVWILDRSARPAFAAWVAGIPNRIGFGSGWQRLFITNAGIDPNQRIDHPIDRLPALMQAMGTPLATMEPNLHIPEHLISAVRKRHGARPRPWIVAALGASHPSREWPYWAELLRLMGDRIGTAFLVGGAAYQAQAANLVNAGPPGRTANACDLSIAEAAALMHEADLFIGPDSGPMNVAAAVGIPAFGLFGMSDVLSYSRFIRAILPDDGKRWSGEPDGMQRISPAHVLQCIAPLLAQRDSPARES